MKYFLFALALCLSVSFSTQKLKAENNTALANNAALFGLAMHGNPKYGAKDTHLDYANPDAPKGGTLRLPATGTFDTINPFTIKGKAAQGLHLVTDRLMARVWDEPFTLYPLIAASTEMPEDRSSITFHLDPGAQFFDGTPVTSADILFSYETLKAYGRPNMQQVYKLADNVEIPDEHTIRFSFGPGYDRETAMIFAMMPVLSQNYWKDREFNSTTLEPYLSNGPYRISEIDPGRRIVYKRNPDYWAADSLTNKGHHNFDYIIYDYYRDENVSQEAFISGGYDLRREFDISRWAGAYPEAMLAQNNILKETLPHGRTEKVRSLIFNTRRAPFDDLRVRQALTLAFNFDWVNKNLFHDLYRRIDSFFPNSELAARDMPTSAEQALLSEWQDELSHNVFGPAWKPPGSPSASAHRRNLREAAALLGKAGWQVIDGTRMKNGEPLQFEIMLGAAEDEKIALHFRQNLKKLGVDVTIRVLDTAAFRARLNEYDFDMTLYHWLSSLSPGTEQILYWSCQAAEEPARWNFAGICSPAVDAIAKNMADTKTRDELVAHTRALDRILTHGHYMIPLHYAGQDFVAYKDHIKRPDKTPLYGMVLETWWMDKDKR